MDDGRRGGQRGWPYQQSHNEPGIWGDHVHSTLNVSSSSSERHDMNIHRTSIYLKPIQMALGSPVGYSETDKTDSAAWLTSAI